MIGATKRAFDVAEDRVHPAKFGVLDVGPPATDHDLVIRAPGGAHCVEAFQRIRDEPHAVLRKRQFRNLPEGGVPGWSDFPSPKCRDGGAGSHEWAFPQSFGAKTIAVDEAYRNQTGCGRNRSVAWTRAPVAKASGTRRRAGADRWHGGGHERSADGEGRVHLVFHPINGQPQRYQPAAN